VPQTLTFVPPLKRRPVSISDCYCGGVKKQPRADPKARTYFEQVPVKALKKLSNLVVEPATTKSEPYSMPSLPPRAARHR